MGTREFTNQDERARRRELVRRIGDAAFGKQLGRESGQGEPKTVWHAEFARAIEAATGRAIGRPRVAQWLLTTDDAKPVPSWVVDALPAIARAAAADLRRRAEELDALEAESGAPPAQGETDAPEELTQESGPAAAEAVPSDDEIAFDIDAPYRLMALGLLARPEPEPQPEPEPAPPTGWRSKFAEENAAHWRSIVYR